jgi:Kef-type K+ transport system membrane component KefB
MLDWLQSLAPPTNVTGARLVGYVLFDIFLVVTLARLLGSALMKIGQPRVVGEILAGVLLGPTLLGFSLSQVIAPNESRAVLSSIATVALILFMFLAGIEYDASQIAGRGRQAVILAALSVGIPALLGFPVALVMHTDAYAGPAGQALLPFALFIGAALSVTAFPVMAHILMERGELNSPMGGLCVATAGIMSVLMFSYIAFASAVAAASGFGGFLTTVGGAAVFVIVAWWIVRPLLARWITEPVTGNRMAIVFGGMVLFGLVAHQLNINALVGGFLWGMIVPASRSFRASIAEKVRDVAMVFLLPIFFAIAGFSTDLKLLTLATLPVIGVVLLAAIGGKFAAALPARAFGLTWRETGVIGALMNTRGLLVLVAGLIGLELQIITALTFTIIVIVALVTNLMTLPLLRRLVAAERA